VSDLPAMHATEEGAAPVENVVPAAPPGEHDPQLLAQTPRAVLPQSHTKVIAQARQVMLSVEAFCEVVQDAFLKIRKTTLVALRERVSGALDPPLVALYLHGYDATTENHEGEQLLSKLQSANFQLEHLQMLVEILEDSC
jgi:hypothetical protein